MALGGRTAEKLFLDDISTGASGDIQQASSIARDMVMRYVIGRDFGQTKSYSEETAGMIDEEVKKIFDEASSRCEKILLEHADQLCAIAEYLLEHETMEAEEFNYFFEHGEFMPLPPQKLRQVKEDKTIERPARKISMTDGDAPAPPAELPAEPVPEQAETTEPAPQTEPPAESGKKGE